jgi:hypothetical protein
MLMRMKLRAPEGTVLLVAAGLLCAAQTLLAVPFGYRYVGSRVVSDGRAVLWYWNVDHLEIGPYGTSFVARMYARAVDVNQERPFVAIVRCDSRAYRGVDAREAYAVIDDGEPIDAVWRAGCDKGVAVTVAQRYARLNATSASDASGSAPSTASAATPPAGTPPTTLAQAPSAKSEPTRVDPTRVDPRRADTCVRFAETRGTPAGDATITNTCSYPIEVTLCYKGGTGNVFDCPAHAKGRHGDSLGPGITHVLPEYRRGRHKGINLVACRGEMGLVFPRLDEAGGKSGCY